MVLSTTKKTSAMSSIVNRNQGGGSKKAGFAYIIGRDHSTPIYFHRSAQSLPLLQKTVFPNVRPSRNIGSVANSNVRYWHMPGTGR